MTLKQQHPCDPLTVTLEKSKKNSRRNQRHPARQLPANQVSPAISRFQVHMELVTLIVSGNTVIQDSSGRNMSLSDLREGMVVDAEFSSAMTFSVPPQSRAFRIIVVNRNAASNITTGRVVSNDYRNGFLYVGYSNSRTNLMRFVITNSTVILDRRGNRTSLRNIRQGQRVRVEHATFQTPSIPPQTTAFVVQII